jgi:hypothetical protein
MEDLGPTPAEAKKRKAVAINERKAILRIKIHLILRKHFL